MVDLTNFEVKDKFLEGTGSIVFDYEGFCWTIFAEYLVIMNPNFTSQGKLPTPVSQWELMQKFSKIFAQK